MSNIADKVTKQAMDSVPKNGAEAKQLAEQVGSVVKDSFSTPRTTTGNVSSTVDDAFDAELSSSPPGGRYTTTDINAKSRKISVGGRSSGSSDDYEDVDLNDYAPNTQKKQTASSRKNNVRNSTIDESLDNPRYGQDVSAKTRDIEFNSRKQAQPPVDDNKRIAQGAAAAAYAPTLRRGQGLAAGPSLRNSSNEDEYSQRRNSSSGIKETISNLFHRRKSVSREHDLSYPDAAVNTQGPSASVSGRGVNVKSPSVQAQSPEMNISTPSAGIKTSSAGVKGAAAGVGAGIAATTAGLSTKSKGPQMKTGDINISGGKASIPDSEVPTLRTKNIDINAPEIENKTSSWKSKLGLGGKSADIDSDLPEIKGPSVNATSPKIKGPSMNVTSPEIKGPSVNAASPEIKGPSLKTAGVTAGLAGAAGAAAAGIGSKMNLKGPEINASGANANIESPNVDVHLPEANIKSSKTDNSLPSVSAPKVDASLSGAKASAPKIDASLPEGNIKGPKFDASMPESHIKAPKLDSSLPDVKAPKVEGSLPELNKPSVDASLPDVDAPEVSSGGWKSMFGFGGSKPQTETRDLDLSAPNVDVNAQSIDTKGASSAIDDLHLGAKSAGTELKSNIDTQLENTSLPSAKVDVNANKPAFSLAGGAQKKKISTDLKGPSMDLKSDVKSPELNMGEIKSPAIDAELPKVEAKNGGWTSKIPGFGGNVESPELNVKGAELNTDSPKLEAPDAKISGLGGNVKSPELNIKGTELNAELPKVDAPEVKGSSWTSKLPGFGAKTDSANIETPSIDAPHIDSMETRGLKFDASGPELNAQAAHWNADLPALNTEGANMDINTPKVDLNAPQLNANAPQVDAKSPSINAKGAAAGVAAGVAGAAAGLSGKLPSLKAKGPEINAPNLEANANAPHVDANLPSVNTDAKLGANFNAPKVDASLPSVNANAPKADLSLPSAKIDTPKLDASIKAPKLDAKSPAIDANIPNAELSTPEGSGGWRSKLGLGGKGVSADANANVPGVNMTSPKIDAKMPNANMKAPTLDAKLPNASVKAPTLDAKIPNASVNAPTLDAKGLNADLRTSGGVNTSLPSVDANLSGVSAPEVEGHGFLFKLGKLGLGPKAHLPDVDVHGNRIRHPTGTVGPAVAVGAGAVGAGVGAIGLGNAQAPQINATSPSFNTGSSSMNANLPSASVNVPSAHIDTNAELPSLNANVKSPKLDASIDGKTGGWKSKLGFNSKKKADVNLPNADAQLPDVNAPKFDAKGPNVDAHLPDVKAPKFDAKAPSVDAHLPDVKGPKFDAKGPNVDAHLPDINAPKFDAKAPQFDAKGPKFDAMAPQFDAKGPNVDAHLPSVNAPKFDAKGPNVDAQLPSVNAPDMSINAPGLNAKSPDLNVKAPTTNSKAALGAVAGAGAGLAAAVGLGSGKINSPSAEAKSQGIETSLPTTKGASIDMETPKFDAKPNVDINSKSLNVNAPSVDAKSPHIDSPSVKADINSPSFDAQAPSLDTKGASLNAQAPSFNAQLPSAQAPQIDAKSPSFNAKGAALGAGAGLAGAAAALSGKSNGKGISAEVQSPSIHAPSVQAPSASIKSPSVDVSGASVQSSSVNVKSPSVKIPTANVDSVARSSQSPPSVSPSGSPTSNVLHGPVHRRPSKVRGPSIDGNMSVADMNAGGIVAGGPGFNADYPNSPFSKWNYSDNNYKTTVSAIEHEVGQKEGFVTKWKRRLSGPEYTNYKNVPQNEIQQKNDEFYGTANPMGGLVTTMKRRMSSRSGKGELSANSPMSATEQKTYDATVRAEQAEFTQSGGQQRMDAYDINAPHLASPSASATAPDAKVDLKLGSTKPNASLKTGDISPSGLNAGATGINVNAPGINAHAPQANIAAPNVNIDASKSGSSAKAAVGLAAGAAAGLAAAGAKLGKGKGTSTNADANLDVQAPSLNAQAPSLNAQAPSLNAQAPSLNAQAPSLNAQAPSIDAKVPSLSAKAPSLDAKVPSVDSKAPSVDAKVPSFNAQAPSLDAQAPSLDAKGPSFNAQVPSVNAKAPSFNAQAPSLDAKVPSVNAQAPSVSAQAPSLNAQAPSFSAHVPSLDAKAPSLDAKTPSLDVKGPSLSGQAPSMSAQTPSLNIKKPTVDAAASSLNPKAPSFKPFSADSKSDVPSVDYESTGFNSSRETSGLDEAIDAEPATEQKGSWRDMIPGLGSKATDQQDFEDSEQDFDTDTEPISHSKGYNSVEKPSASSTSQGGSWMSKISGYGAAAGLGAAGAVGLSRASKTAKSVDETGSEFETASLGSYDDSANEENVTSGALFNDMRNDAQQAPQNYSNQFGDNSRFDSSKANRNEDWADMSDTEDDDSKFDGNDSRGGIASRQGAVLDKQPKSEIASDYHGQERGVQRHNFQFDHDSSSTSTERQNLKKAASTQPEAEGQFGITPTAPGLSHESNFASELPSQNISSPAQTDASYSMPGAYLFNDETDVPSSVEKAVSPNADDLSTDAKRNKLAGQEVLSKRALGHVYEPTVDSDFDHAAQFDGSTTRNTAFDTLAESKGNRSINTSSLAPALAAGAGFGSVTAALTDTSSSHQQSLTEPHQGFVPRTPDLKAAKTELHHAPTPQEPSPLLKPLDPQDKSKSSKGSKIAAGGGIGAAIGAITAAATSKFGKNESSESRVPPMGRFGQEVDTSDRWTQTGPGIGSNSSDDSLTRRLDKAGIANREDTLPQDELRLKESEQKQRLKQEKKELKNEAKKEAKQLKKESKGGRGGVMDEVDAQRAHAAYQSTPYRASTQETLVLEPRGGTLNTSQGSGTQSTNWSKPISLGLGAATGIGAGLATRGTQTHELRRQPTLEDDSAQQSAQEDAGEDDGYNNDGFKEKLHPEARTRGTIPTPPLETAEWKSSPLGEERTTTQSHHRGVRLHPQFEHSASDTRFDGQAY